MPYPVDYGGVFDLFYKIKELHSLGVKIHLHCFDYGRGEQPELNKYCEEVFYYSRNEGHKGFSFKLPYIVASGIILNYGADCNRISIPFCWKAFIAPMVCTKVCLTTEK